MTVKGTLSRGILTLRLSGEIDESCALRLRAEIDRMIGESPANAVVFDMSGVRFMDSTGIGLLLGRYKKHRDAGISFYIMNPCPLCEKLFALSGIYRVITKIGSLADVQ